MRASESALEVAGKITENGLGRFPFEIHDEIERRLVEPQGGSPAPVDFADPPFEAVPIVGFPNFPGCRDPDPRMAEVVRHGEHDHEPAEQLHALLVRPQEVAALRNPLRFRQIFRGRQAQCSIDSHRLSARPMVHARARLRQKGACDPYGDARK